MKNSNYTDFNKELSSWKLRLEEDIKTTEQEKILMLQEIIFYLNNIQYYLERLENNVKS